MARLEILPPFCETLAIAVLDDLPLGLWVAEVPSGEPVYINRAFRSITGQGTTQGLDPRGMGEVYRMFDRQGRPFPPERLPFSQVLASGQPVVVDDMVIHRQDGQRIFLRAFATPTGEVARGQGHIVVAFTDISAEVKAQEARQSLEKQLTFAVNHAPIVLWMHDREGNISLSEGAALAGLGVKPGQLVGQSVFEMYQDQPSILNNVRRALSGEAVSDLYHNDQDFTLQSHLAPTFGPDGEVTGVIGVATDVTELRRLEERLFHSEKMEAVGRLAGGIAHDFNNLLAAIQGFAWLCRQRHPVDHQTRDDADQILRSCERGEMLVKQLLAFSRKQPIKLEVISLAGLVMDLEPTLRRLISPDIDIRTTLAPDAGRVNADPAQLEHLLINLVVNSRDAMPAGGRLTIEVANATLDEAYTRTQPGVAPGDYVMLAVTDSGMGMDPETRHRMFEPFFTTKERNRGTGLGLASVYGIAKQCQGHLAVTSELDQGTCIRVYLPRTEDPVSARAPQPVRPAPLHGIETVLVVEDHEILRQLSCQILRHYGYQVLEAGEPASAISLCQEHPRDIHLLLTDVVLPGMNGFELATRARELRPALPVLFMSGYAAEAVQRHRGEVVLEKPFAPQTLLAQIRKLLDGAPAS